MSATEIAKTGNSRQAVVGDQSKGKGGADSPSPSKTGKRGARNPSPNKTGKTGSKLAEATRPLSAAAIFHLGAHKNAEKRIEHGSRVADEALRESEEKYHGAERIKGYRAEEIIGRNLSSFFPPEDIECGRPEEVLRTTSASGRHEEQGMLVRKDGSP